MKERRGAVEPADANLKMACEASEVAGYWLAKTLKALNATRDEAAAIRCGERSGCYFETDLRRLLNTLKKPIIEKMKTSQPRKLSSPLARAVCGIQATDSDLSGLLAKPRTAIWCRS